jgi:endonuclease G
LSFYYSNVAPQLPALNRGIWKNLEEYTRKLAKEYVSVPVVCGSVAIEDKHIGSIAVPDICWKIIYIKKSAIVQSFLFRNDIILRSELSSIEVSVDSIQNLSGMVFKIP